MRIDILTLFPETLGDVLSESILGRAQERGFIKIDTHQIRDYTANKQNQVDDYPYGGGRGAVMTADPLYRCWEAVCDEAGGPVHTIYLSPCGHTFKQEDAIRLSKLDNIIMVCGHYEGIDQRFIDECVDEEISLGDFVLTGGEIAAMAVTDAVCRMVPGVLADPECFEDESHYSGLLEYPQYTRPAVWHGRQIPQILTSETTRRSASGGASRPCAGPGNAGPICMRNWIFPPSRTRSCSRRWRKRTARKDEAPRCRRIS